MNRRQIESLIADVEALEKQAREIRGRLEQHLDTHEVTEDLPPNEKAHAALPQQYAKKHQSLIELVESFDFRRERNAKLRFLMTLGRLAKIHGDNFDRIREVRGKKRIYFAKSRQEISKSGRSLNPENIPGTSYYTATNLSNDRKSRIIREVLICLGEDKSLAEYVGAKVDPTKTFSTLPHEPSYQNNDDCQI